MLCGELDVPSEVAAHVGLRGESGTSATVRGPAGASRWPVLMSAEESRRQLDYLPCRLCSESWFQLEDKQQHSWEMLTAALRCQLLTRFAQLTAEVVGANVN